jgi:hypothetical protein
VLLRTLRFLGIKTCELTEELGGGYNLIDRTDLFKISNLVLCAEVIVTDLYSSLEG